jgi:Tol biopolymer transport system component
MTDRSLKAISQSVSAAPVSCGQRATVIGVRGSGDPQSGDEKADKYGLSVHGMGKPGAAFAVDLANDLPGGVITFLPVIYPAVGVLGDRHHISTWSKYINGIGAGSHVGFLGAYTGSVNDGKKALRQEIADEERLCSNIKLVLVGYSQGAQVVGDVYQRNLTAQQRARIVGVVLFGDPYFNPNDSAVDQGSFDPTRHGVLGTRAKYAASASTRVFSICHLYDPICQGPGRMKASAHTTYETDSWVKTAAAKIAAELKSSGPTGSSSSLLAYDYAPIPNTGIGHTIYVVSPNGGQPRPIAHTSDNDPAWSHDGKWLAFATPYAPGACQDCNDIAVVSASGSDEHYLTSTGTSGNPAWSPDGKWIAFDANANVISGPSQVYLVSADGKTLRAVTPASAGSFGPPSWSPTGKQLVAPGPGGLWLMSSTGHERRRIVRGAAETPLWSPNGKWIMFTRSLPAPGRQLKTETYLVSPTGANLHRLGDASMQRTFGAWSPDSSHIVFVGSANPTASTAPTSGSLYVISVNGTGQRLLLGASGVYLNNPAWSPDGKLIAFLEPHLNANGTLDDNNDDVFVIPANYGKARVVSGVKYAWPGSWLLWQP